MLPYQFLLDYLRTKGLEALQTEFHVRATPHPELPNLIHLKYHQFDSPRGNEIVDWCRGCILDRDNYWLPVAMPFQRFYNHGEGPAAIIDWKMARVQEKIDGSLCILYYYNGAWRVATSGSPNAGGSVGDSGNIFSELFFQTLEGNYLESFPQNTRKTYLFELTGPSNRVILRYPQHRLTCIGVRDLDTGLEEQYSEGVYATPKEYPLKSIEDVLATYQILTPLESEGYVIVDANWNRLKVKHPTYLALHHLKDSIVSDRAVLSLALSPEPIDEELLAYFPSLPGEVAEYRRKFADLLDELEEDYLWAKSMKSQKDFAFGVLHSKCSGALFAVRKGKSSSIKSYLETLSRDSLLELL